jgi:CheY-like chemotaxis protein
MSALVLVVDDDDAIRELTALALEKAGYRVQRASSAA